MIVGSVAVLAFVLIIVGTVGLVTSTGSDDSDEPAAQPTVPEIAPGNAPLTGGETETPGTEPSLTLDGERVEGLGFAFDVPAGWESVDPYSDGTSVSLLRDATQESFEAEEGISVYLFGEDAIQREVDSDPLGVCTREANALSSFTGGDPEREPERELDGVEMPGVRLAGDEEDYLLFCAPHDDHIYNVTAKVPSGDLPEIIDDFDAVVASWEWTDS